MSLRLLLSRSAPTHLRRSVASLNRPAPIPLPREQQREFELLQRAAQSPLAGDTDDSDDLQLHPDARELLKPEFEGDTNPTTGEQGGPKWEPVGRWAEGDWSFKGRVSDF
ncbi:hypothetical protein B0H15DRAFT_849246 [Mycena belliarum]|uniref:Succinate dehydrogenase assembly factor 4, mitochondrial n=1 Tax=Mycena belliarum TaxID=1033014 RepID=A0AAD6TYV7_9AGAR|nr:hypothetical protein B0H15DRAFT_849246 [Mycena belliae]